MFKYGEERSILGFHPRDFALTTVAIRHVGAQTNSLNREITVRTKA